MTEKMIFEVTLYFEGGYDGSINDMKQQISRAIFISVDTLSDMEIDCIKTERSQ